MYSPTNHDEFRETFEELGFTVEVDYQPDPELVPEDDPLPTLVARNENDDQVFWCILQKTDDWGIHIDLYGATLDNSEFRPGQGLTFKRDCVVIDRASGTRSKDFGYGVSSFDGSVELDSFSATINESYSV